MKNAISIFFFVIYFLMFNKAAANPVVVYWISEFGFDSTGWKMELHCDHAPQDSMLLDDWCLTSNSDTAYFKAGISFITAGYLVISNDDLQSKLEINIEGDVITLCRTDQGYVYPMDDISFGRDISVYPILTPVQGQSICKSQDIYLYFDKTPTFGFVNDTTNIKGFIEGYVKDLFGHAIQGVKVNNSVLTDSNGYFKMKNYAQKTYLSFKKDNYNDSNIVVQIYPDSTVTIGNMNLITGIIEKFPSTIIKDFYMSQNFPNPFNNSTSFFYILPKGDYVEITIYDEKGALVKKLFSGSQSAGKYKVNWKTDDLASGVYIYNIRTGSFNISKKAVLLK